MDKNVKTLLLALNYLTKTFKGNPTTFEDYSKALNKLNFKNYATNKGLFEFFNNNVKEGVRWEDLEELSKFTNSFLTKIELIRDGIKKPKELFTDPIDDKFRLFSGNRYVNFHAESIEMVFGDSYSQFYLDLINLDEHDMHTYFSAQYNGDCYSPDDFNEDIVYCISLVDSENAELLALICLALNRYDIYKDIMSNVDDNTTRPIQSDRLINKILELLQSAGGDRYLSDMYDEYKSRVNEASCDEIKSAFKEHFSDYGVWVRDSETIGFTYDFFIDFLSKNPDIQTFADLKGHNFIEYSSSIEDAAHEGDLDVEGLNRDFNYILNRLYDKISDSDEMEEKLKNIEEFENMMKSLKFDYTNMYVLQVVDKNNNLKYKFEIEPSQINYENKKLYLRVKNYAPGGDVTTHLIPFEDVPKYVTMEKLFENLVKKIKKFI